MHYDFKTKNVCAATVSFDLEDGKLKNVRFVGGCNGNLKAIGKLCEGKDAAEIANTLRGNTCGLNSTSCADQLAHAIDAALAGN